MTTRFLTVLLVAAFSGCVPPGASPRETRPMVNVQVTEDEDLVALQAFMAELDRRRIRATLIVDAFVATEGCEALRRYDREGHEIMVYGRPAEPPGETVTLTMLPAPEQRAIIGGAKSAIEECLAHSVAGFRSYRFAHNEDTWQILDDLGIEYNLSFVAHSSNALPGYEDHVWPYPVGPYRFWAVPMHSAELGGQLRAFCDMPFSGLAAADWEDKMKSELDRVAELGLPLKVEFHPYFSANDPGRWEAFVNFLEYAESREAEFITVSELLNRTPVTFR